MNIHAQKLGKTSWKKRSQGMTKEQIATMMGNIKRGKKKVVNNLSTPSLLQ